MSTIEQRDRHWLMDSYYQAYELIRGITGFGTGNGPIIAIHEGFLGVAAWADFMKGADRLYVDRLRVVSQLISVLLTNTHTLPSQPLIITPGIPT